MVGCATSSFSTKAPSYSRKLIAHSERIEYSIVVLSEEVRVVSRLLFRFWLNTYTRLISPGSTRFLLIKFGASLCDNVAAT